VFLNYSYHFYIFFLSCIFASGTFSYFLFFSRPTTFTLADKHVREEREDTHNSKARNFTRNGTLADKHVREEREDTHNSETRNFTRNRLTFSKNVTLRGIK
jgi:hypothetical protein